MKTAVFIYETIQVKALSDLLKKLGATEAYDIIACGADIEFLLEEKNIPYVSAHPFRAIPTTERLIHAKKIGEDIFDEPALSFYTYKGVSIGKLFVPSMQYYLMMFLYDLDIVAAALLGSYKKVLTYAPAVTISPLARVFDTLSNQAYPDALHVVCEKQGIELGIYTLPGTSRGLSGVLREKLFDLKRAAFGAAMRVLNVYVRARIHKKKIRILASELWKNIEPLMSELAESELLLLDRAESLQIGFRNILSHRMQFVHTSDFITPAMHSEQRAQALHFKKQWKEYKAESRTANEAMFAGHALRSILISAVDHFIHASERVLREIDGSQGLIEFFTPDVVMVRAGISAQTHFAVLCEIARLHDVPSLEVQHGILSAFEGDFTSNPSPEYIAEYGPIVREELEKHNFAPRSTFIDIGSPRFDVYTKQQERKPMEDGTFRILHIGPQLSPGGWNDSYDVIDYFNTLASAARHIPHVHITVKLRATRVSEDFYREAIARAFKDIPHDIAIFEPLSELFSKADVVVSGHSTSFLEALLSGKPLIIDTSLPIFAELTRVDLGRHLAAGALKTAGTPEVLRDTLQTFAQSPKECEAASKRALQFMREHYLFNDGKSSQRLADFIRSLAEKE